MSYCTTIFLVTQNYVIFKIKTTEFSKLITFSN